MDITTANPSQSTPTNGRPDDPPFLPDLAEPYADLKREIIGPNGPAILASWTRLLTQINTTIAPTIHSQAANIIPSISHATLSSNNFTLPPDALSALKETGCIIIRGLNAPEQAIKWREDIKEYIDRNREIGGIPLGEPQLWDLYWSRASVEARGHENMLAVQKMLNNVWQAREEDECDLDEVVTYVDRFRIRKPGNTSFALGPHVDGGSIERWEDINFRSCYEKIFTGRWEEHDPFDISPRLKASGDLYSGATCSIFRSWQGWLSLSESAPTHGTLCVLPSLKASTAYILLRPLIASSSSSPSPTPTLSTNSLFAGCFPGRSQVLHHTTHPHLLSPSSSLFVSIPTIHPGDAVFWHPDIAHMVDPVHLGDSENCVLYIPSSFLSEGNVAYLEKQREAFEKGAAPWDFARGREEEGGFMGRGAGEDLRLEGRRAMGLESFKVDEDGKWRREGARKARERANEILGFK